MKEIEGRGKGKKWVKKKEKRRRKKWKETKEKNIRDRRKDRIKARKKRDQFLNIEIIGKKEGKREEMGKSLIYREIHFLTHNKINLLNSKSGFL